MLRRYLALFIFGVVIGFGSWSLSVESTATVATRNFQLVVTVVYPDAALSQNRGSFLTLRGSTSPLSWGVGAPMTKVASNTWQITLNMSISSLPSQSTTLEFKPMVNDKVWSIGSNFFFTVSAAGKEAVLASTFYPWFFTPEGQYKYIYGVYSPQLKNTRNLVVYTPPSYLENTLKSNYPTLFMQDGQNLFNASTSFAGAWNCQDTVNQMVYEGRMEEIIIVGVDNTDIRTDEYTYSYDPSVGAGGLGDLYLDFLANTVIPVIESSYPRANVADQTGILGSSLGGLISCYAGYTRTQRWPIAGCMSSSFWWNDQDFNNTIMIKYPPPSPPSLHVYLDSGDAGASFDDVVETRTVLHHFEADNFVLNQTLYYYLDKGGQHNEYYWGQRFWVPMTYLYPPQPSPVQSQN